MVDILFILPVGGGSGGAHSVMQEADTMCRMGVSVYVAANTANAQKLRNIYKDLATISRHIVDYSDAAGLGKYISEMKPKVAVATTNQSVAVLAAALKTNENGSHTRAAYYIQDYEPYFYEYGSNEWIEAYQSYTLIEGMLCYAKTRWLKQIVEANHKTHVNIVTPSIDHNLYYPYYPARIQSPEKFTLCAMLRPATPRRAPRRTVRIINRIAAEFGQTVRCTSFGCTLDEMYTHNLRFENVDHRGILQREEVADLYRSTDMFLDLSDYQAFGRSAIEAMATGVVCVVPEYGGASEFARNFTNCFVVDTRDDDQIMNAVRAYLAFSPADRRIMADAAIVTAQQYTLERAAISELTLLL